MTDPVVTIIMLSGIVICVVFASYAGWLGGVRSERAHSARWLSQLVNSEPADLLRRDDEIAEVVERWWDNGYSVGYKDGKNNKRRQDKANKNKEAR